MKVYVASSWRNDIQPLVVACLREAGHEVYDFKNPPHDAGFGWEQINEDWQSWTPGQWLDALSHPVAQAGFSADMGALEDCDACVLVIPCGRSAHLEFGWACGAGKLTVYYQTEKAEPELMARMADHIAIDLQELLALFVPVGQEAKGGSQNP